MFSYTNLKEKKTNCQERQIINKVELTRAE